jgi:hypothetical protein
MLAGMRGMAHVVPRNHRATPLHRVAQFLGGLDRDEARQFVNWVYFLDEPEKSLLLTATCANKLLASEQVIRSCLSESRLSDAGNRVLHVDVQTREASGPLSVTSCAAASARLSSAMPLLISCRSLTAACPRRALTLRWRCGCESAWTRTSISTCLGRQLKSRGF